MLRSFRRVGVLGRRRVGVPPYCCMGVGALASPKSPLTPGRVVCHCLMGNEVPDPSLASLTPPWCRGWGTWLQPGRGESRVLTRSLGARVERRSHSCFFRCLAGVEKLSSKSPAFLGCPFPGPLAGESRLLLGFFCLLSMAFLGCQVLKLQVWDI